MDTEQEEECWTKCEETASSHATDLIRRVSEGGKSTMPPGFLVLVAGKMKSHFSSGMLCGTPAAHHTADSMNGVFWLCREEPVQL